MFVTQFIGIGNLGGDPEKRYDDSGRPRMQFRMAVRNRKKDGDEWVDDTWWIRVIVFGPQVERLSQQLQKGSRVLVVGPMDTPTTYSSQDGSVRVGSSMVANQVQPLDRPADIDREQDAYEPARAPAGASQGRPRQAQAANSAASSDLDDLPF